MNNDNDDVFSYLGYNVVGDSSRNIEFAQTDYSHDSISKSYINVFPVIIIKMKYYDLN